MEHLKLYIYNQIYIILNQISIDYNLDLNNLKNKYMQSYKNISVEEIIINNEVYYIDSNKNIYNKSGFITNIKI
jgi:hypothetical protein